MKIAFFEVMPGEREMLTAHLPAGHDISFHEEKLAPATTGLAADADIVSVFVKSEVTPEVIDALPGLKLITTRSMGYDHIALAHAASKGIKAGNVTTYAAHPVAEFTFALMLAVTRRIYPAYERLREGTAFDTRGLGGFNLYGKTLGVLGTGRIGRNVIGIGKGFGMRVLAYDPKPDTALAAGDGFTYADADDVIAQADIITLHMPYLPATHHFLNKERFAKMKKGVIIVNTARGEVMDTHALVAALRDGTVWGAGLDVLEQERELKEEVEALTTDKPGVDYELLTANHILIDMPNVVVTPHIAFETAEAMEEISRVTAETISNFIAGKDQKYL